MPSPPVHNRPNKRVRLLPRRGPVHLIALLATALVTLLLPLGYIVVVQGIGVFLGWSGFLTVKALLIAEGFPLIELCRVVCLAIAGAGWVGMVRPLLPVERRHPAAMQVTKNTQPSLFALTDMLCRNLRVPMPSEVWLDCTGSVRTSMRHGIRGITRGDLVLSVGMPMVAVLNARELAAVLAMEIGQCAGGLGVTLTHIVREMNAWFFRALYHRDPWEEALDRTPEDEGSGVFKAMRRVASVFIWTSQRPFWLMMTVARWVSFVPMYMIRARSHEGAVRLIGTDGLDRLQQKQRYLAKVMKQARKSIDEGVSHARLPENFALLVSRLFTKELDAAPPLAARTKSAGNPPAAHLIDQLPTDAEGAALIRQFVDLARQITYFYYQHELDIAIHKHRMVAHDETLYQKRHQAEALSVIRRYFGGLMHPERALCGLAVTGSSTDAGDLAQEVIKCRAWEKQYESQVRIALREWNLAWQRRRDFECAWVLTLAGYAVCRLDYGTEQSNPETYRKEAKAQKMIMDHLDDPLRMCESHLEKRFAAALGMLWYSQLEILPDRLVEMRKQMPLWATAFESLAGVLPEFRELLTSFYSFQTLGGRVASASDSGAFASAMQSVVPGMMARARHIAKALDGACYPFNEDGIAIPLSDYLCASLGGSTPPDPSAALGMHAMARQMAHDASVMLTPFVDRYLELYHRSFAWLAAAAEASENYFVGPVYSDEVVSSEVESLAGLIKTEAELKEREMVMV